MNILEETKRIMKMNPALQAIPAQTQIELGIAPTADRLPDDFVAELARRLFDSTDGKIRIEVIPKENVRTDKNGEHFSFLRGTDILCHERNVLVSDGQEEFEALVEKQTPCLFTVSENPKNGKLVSRYCSIYTIPSGLGFKIAPTIKEVLLDYCSAALDGIEKPVKEHVVEIINQDDAKGNNDDPRKEVVTELFFGPATWTKYYKFVYNRQITKEDFKEFLKKENLWFIPKDEETLEINSLCGGTAWTYYAEKGQLPE